MVTNKKKIRSILNRNKRKSGVKIVKWYITRNKF